MTTESWGVIVLPNDRRRGLRHAKREHFEEHLTTDDAGVGSFRVYWLLRPYWLDGMKFPDAVAAWRAANPEEVI